MQQDQQHKRWSISPVSAMKRFGKVGLVAMLTFSLSGVCSTAAYASEASILDGWSEAAENSTSANYQAYTTSDSDEAVALSDDSEATLPEKYDLRDQGIVTPVKFQNPWGTCWGFSIIAACETSILAKAQTTYDATKLDLSELQLVSAVYRNGGAPESLVGALQAGEGYHNSSANYNLSFDSGGFFTYGANIFASGIGPTLESLATYRNTGVFVNDSTTHADDPVYTVIVTREVEEEDTDDATDKADKGDDAADDASDKSDDSADGTGDDANGGAATQAEEAEPKKITKTTLEYLTQSQIDALEKDETVVNYRKKYYAGNYTTTGSDGEKVTTFTDWSIASQYGKSVDDDDLSWWNTSLMNLENGNELPDTRNLNADGTFASVNWAAVNAIKNELYDDEDDPDDFSRAVSVAFCADTSMPSDVGNKAQYISSKWAHYTYDNGEANHAVTIVGWDDNYDKSNFAAGFTDAATHTPEGNGAWLVKNSWGSETGDSFDSQNFPSSWGIEDANGKHTGYFWISYYDTSLCMAESYDFDINSYSDNTEYIADQYDYLASDWTVVNSSETPLYSANIFTAEEDMDLRTLSCATYTPNSKVEYRVYLLDSEDAKPGDDEHSKLVLTVFDSYDYGGYHRFTLQENQWIPMREGQNYAVVTTQKSEDDGLYYQGVAINRTGKPSEEELEEYAKAYKAGLENYYRTIFTSYYTEWYQTEEGQEELKERGLTPEQALEVDVAALMADEELIAAIEARVNAAVENRRDVYFEAKVNEGESLTGASNGASESDKDYALPADTEWADWTEVVKAVNDEYLKKTGSSVAVDNAPIKAFAEINDYAEVDELTSLKDAIAAAKKLLDSVVVSADGTDVATDKQWMTQSDYDALKAAIEAAEQVLATAGDDYENELILGTASSDEVNGQTKTLAGFAAQPGTKKSSVEPSGDPSGKPSNKGGLPQTGDTTICMVVVSVSFAGLAGAGAYVARRRYNN